MVHEIGFIAHINIGGQLSAYQRNKQRFHLHKELP